MNILTKALSENDFAILVRICQEGKYGTYGLSNGKAGEYETYRVAMGTVFRYLNVAYNGLPETIIVKNGKLRDGDWNRYQQQHRLVMTGIDIGILINLGVYRHGHGMNFDKLSQLIKEYRDELLIKELIEHDGREEAYEELLKRGIAADKLFFL